MLTLCTCIVTAFLPSPTPPLLAVPRSTISVQLNLAEERVESVKAGVIAAFSGSLAEVPVKASALLASSSIGTGAVKASAFANFFTAQWEFNTYALAVQLALFGVVYRCIVRSDDNVMLTQGAVGAFAMCHALSATQVTSMWSTSMWVQLGTYFSESVIAFGVAAATLEFAWSKGFGRRLPGVGLPPDRYGWRPWRPFRDEQQYYLDEPPPGPYPPRDPYYGNSLPPPSYRGEPPPPFIDDAPRYYEDARDEARRY